VRQTGLPSAIPVDHYITHDRHAVIPAQAGDRKIKIPFCLNPLDSRLTEGQPVLSLTKGGDNVEFFYFPNSILGDASRHQLCEPQ
jgi:hypothetical protein